MILTIIRIIRHQRQKSILMISNQVTDSPLLMLQSLTVGTVVLRMKTRNVAHVKVMVLMMMVVSMLMMMMTTTMMRMMMMIMIMIMIMVMIIMLKMMNVLRNINPGYSK